MQYRRRMIVCATLMACMILPQNAQAWSAGGHRVIAYIAYRRLSEGTKARLLELLKKHPRLEQEFKRPRDVSKEDYAAWRVTQAAVWPDLIRRKRPWDHPTWHYINEPVYLDDADRLALKDKLKINLSRMLPSKGGNRRLNIVQALKLCREKLKEKTVSDKEKAVYVCWLLHLVGDVHQPLHSTALFSKGRFPKGDRGGNLIPVRQNRNLHSFWDGLLGRRYKHRTVVRRAVTLPLDADLNKAGEQAAKQLEFEVWVRESTKLSKEVAYHASIIAEVKSKEEKSAIELVPVDLPLSYRKKAGAVAQRRAVEAGYRLAAVLEAVLK